MSQYQVYTHAQYYLALHYTRSSVHIGLKINTYQSNSLIVTFSATEGNYNKYKTYCSAKTNFSG